jgi:tetratricopeptide (TPR) repeat protein
MPRSIVAAALGTLFLFAAALAAPTGKWVEVRSQNFIVVSNAGEGQARKTAVQFEQIRSLFRDSLSYVKNSPSPVITILAVKDEDSLRELLPEYWAQKGHSHPAGVFLDGGYDQFQVAVNLAAHGDNPYEGLYHEYYHSVTMPYFPGLPVWVAEGMADFFGNSAIGDKNANLGMPNAALIEELRNSPLIPLATLFKVDHNSPYYNEQNKVSIFYAESWALIHYLMLGDQRSHNPSFGAYLNAVSQGASQDEAAAKAFGDLRKLQDNLEKYIGRFSFPIVQVPAPAKVPDSSLSMRTLSEAEVDAYSGGFLVLHRQFEQADPLLKESAQLDPKLALAQRNLAFLHLYRDEHTDALTSLSAAIALDPQDATTRFLRAELTFDGVSHTDPQIETDLRQAIALKADFANANGLLSVYLAANNEKLPEALTFGQKAVSLQPGNVNLQLILAHVLASMRRYDEAERLGRAVLARATEDGIRTEANQILTYVSQARDYDARERQRQEESAARANALAAAARSEQAAARADQIAARTDEARPESLESSADKISAPSGPSADPNAPVLKRRAGGTDVIGVVIQVHCNGNEMDVTAKIPDRQAPLLFHAKDRTRIGYTSNISAIHEDIDPCSELRGHTAKIVFTPSASKWLDGDLVHIEVVK